MKFHLGPTRRTHSTLKVEPSTARPSRGEPNRTEPHRACSLVDVCFHSATDPRFCCTGTPNLGGWKASLILCVKILWAGTFQPMRCASRDSRLTDLRKSLFSFLTVVWIYSKIYLNVSGLIPKCLQNLSSCLIQHYVAKYADDTAIMAVGDHLEEATDKLQRAADKISNWTAQWFIKRNEDKSIHVNFTNKRCRPIPIITNGKTIP